MQLPPHNITTALENDPNTFKVVHVPLNKAVTLLESVPGIRLCIFHSNRAFLPAKSLKRKAGVNGSGDLMGQAAGG